MQTCDPELQLQQPIAKNYSLISEGFRLTGKGRDALTDFHQENMSSTCILLHITEYDY